MKSKTIIFRDPVVERVCDKFVKRSDVGYAKYGRTLHDERTGRHKNLAGYLNDVQEELMDAILYIQAAKEEISDWPLIEVYGSDFRPSLKHMYEAITILNLWDFIRQNPPDEDAGYMFSNAEEIYQIGNIL